MGECCSIRLNQTHMLLDDFVEIIQKGYDCPIGAYARSQERLITVMVKKGKKKVLGHSCNKEIGSAS